MDWVKLKEINFNELDKYVKNCPCCGNTAFIESYEVRKGYEADIHCSGCMLNYHTITFDTENDAIEDALNGWNKRI